MKAYKKVHGKKVEIEIVKVGDKYIEVDGYNLVDGKQVPKMKVNTIEKKNAQGGTDITVQIPYLNLSAVENDLAGKPKGGN